jgi:G3E family GTPase
MGVHKIICEGCKKTKMVGRIDAKACSPRCRNIISRRKKKEEIVQVKARIKELMNMLDKCADLLVLDKVENIDSKAKATMLHQILGLRKKSNELGVY